MVLTDFFDKVYCINLDRRLDRWIKVSEIFKKNRFKNVERFSAIDGKNLNNTTKLLSGELGILETHLQLIKKCKDENIKSVLILEDDVEFSTEIKNIEKMFLDIPDDWDMIYFGGNHTYGSKLEIIKNNVYKLNYTVSLHCVAINCKIFDEILNLISDKQRQVDSYYTELQKKHNCYGFYPNLAYQSKDYSDIQNKIVDYTNFFK
jgi:hypothetical protein